MISYALWYLKEQSAGLHQRTDALGAQYFADLLAIFVDRDGLKVGFEGTWSSLFGPRAITSESSFFSTMSTLSHNSSSLPRFNRVAAGMLLELHNYNLFPV